MDVKCKTIEHKASGEFVNKETGEVVKWGDRTESYVFFPGEEFPSKVILKGKLPLGDGVLKVRFTTVKDQPKILLGEFTLGVHAANSAFAQSVAPGVSSPLKGA